MNSENKLTKSMTVVLLVAFASLATTGLVLADHYPPVGSVSMSSLRSFEQYQTAIDHMEEDQAAALTIVDSSRNFVPYLDAFDQTELDRRNVVITTQTSADTRTSGNFLPYLDELDQTGPVTLQTSGDDSSWLFWEQYFKYAR